MSGYSMQNQRQLRVAEQIRHILSDVIRDCFFDDPDLMGVNSLTVSEVRISPDLKNATAYVMPLGQDQLIEDEMFMKALNRASSYFRKELSRQTNLRYTPRIRFEVDQSFVQAPRINTLLSNDKVRHDVQKQEASENEDMTGTY